MRSRAGTKLDKWAALDLEQIGQDSADGESVEPLPRSGTK